jgi:2-hydroxychromene-2-carboxylate isomerase
MSARVEFFYDLSSPWTYLAFTNLWPMLERTGEQSVLRPILVGGVFNAVNPVGLCRARVDRQPQAQA